MIDKFSVILLTCAIACCGGCTSENKEPAAASQNQPTASTSSEKPGQPVYGDMIVRGTIGDASVLLPVLSSDGSSNDVNSLIYNGLVRYDKNIELEGELADKWEISDDNLKITFHLRKDVKWHDGHPFTAKDVEYTYKVTVNPATPTAYATDFLKVKEFQVLDPYTVEVTYDKPYAPALGSWGMGMLPSHLLEGKDITKSPLKRKPIGTGPYKFRGMEDRREDRRGQQSRVLRASAVHRSGHVARDP